MDGQNNYQDNTANIPYQAPPQMDEGPHKANGMQIASLVLGIISIVLCCCNGYGAIFAIIGIVLSVLGGKSGKHGIGTAGLVCSIVGLVFSLIIIVLNMILPSMAVDLLHEMGYTEEMLRNMGYTDEMLRQLGY